MEEEAKNEQKPEVTVKMVRYKNTSPIALTINELNTVVPKGGYSAPMPEPTESIKAYLDGNLMTVEEVDITNIPAEEVKGVMAGNKSEEIDTTGSAKPEVANPAKPTSSAAPDYIPFSKTSNEEKVKNYDQSGAVKQATANTVVSVGTDIQAFNQHDEIPKDEASAILKQASSGKFSEELDSNKYVEDEAKKLISSAAGVVSTPAPTEAAVPEGTPEEFHPFFKQTLLQKKITIFKSNDPKYLSGVKPFEKHPAVVSCIDQRLEELPKE